MLLVLGFFVGAAIWFLDWTLGSGMCRTTIYATAASPKGDVTARVQMTDCGATTGFSRIVMLEKPGFWRKECRALALRGEYDVRLKWQSNTVLSISHNASQNDVIAANDVCFGHAIKLNQDK